MSGGKHHTAEGACQFRRRRQRYAVKGDAAPLANGDGGVLTAAARLKRESQLCRIRAKLHHFRILRPAKTAAAGKQPASLQQVGLSLGIVTVEDINTPVGLPPSGVQIAKTLKGQLSDPQR